MKINRLLTNICSQDVEKTKAFYLSLFDFELQFDSDWFVNLVSSQIEIGIISADHEIVPEGIGIQPSGFYITFVVESVDEAYEIATAEGYQVFNAPHDTAYGQRRLVLSDPNGIRVDISSPIPDFQF